MKSIKIFLLIVLAVSALTEKTLIAEDKVGSEAKQAINLTGDAFHKKGMESFQKKDYDSSIRDFTEYINHLNGLQTSDKGSLYDAYRHRAEVYHAKGDTAAAELDFQKADEISVLMEKALTARDGVDLDNEIKKWTKMIESTPNSDSYDDAVKNMMQAHNYLSRGIAYSDKGDYDAAIKDYNKVIELNPDSGAKEMLRDVFNKKVVVSLQKKDYDSSILAFTEEINYLNGLQAPTSDKWALSEAYHHRARAYRAKGDTAAAELDFQKAEEIKY